MSLFTTVKVPRVRRNTFNLSHHNKLSTNMGRLTPILCEEVLPGDQWHINSNSLVRLAPMLAPMMHNVNVFMHYFFVPNRILWNEWEDFITGGSDGTANPSFPRLSLVPAAIRAYAGIGSLADYMGVNYADGQQGDTNSFGVNALPFRAYQMIYNEYYRDQNLQDPIPFSLSGGSFTDQTEVENLLALRNRAWQKDYFTSALPFTQRGPEAVIPISGTESGSSDVYYKGDNQGIQKWYRPDGVVPTTGDSDAFFSRSTGEDGSRLARNYSGQTVAMNMDPQGTLAVNLDEIGIEANDLRASMALQIWLERNARGGGRYFEQIRSHFGVSSPDSRLQRPEFLGGGRAPIAISEVLQTSSTDGESPQANMAGHGISAGRTNSCRYFAQEHGFIIGIMSIMPRTAYQQGVRRFFRKFNRFDYAFPEFAHLGEQDLFNFELYLDIDPDTSIPGNTVEKNLETFGYTPRFAEYKFSPDTTHGDFKDTLDYWTMTRIFNNRPNLNESFVQSDPTHRIFAVDDSGETDKCWCLVQNLVKVRRALPKFGVPRLIG